MMNMKLELKLKLKMRMMMRVRIGRYLINSVEYLNVFYS